MKRKKLVVPQVPDAVINRLQKLHEKQQYVTRQPGPTYLKALVTGLEYLEKLQREIEEND